MSEFFVQDSPDMQRRQQLADMLTRTGQERGPVQHWTQGLNRLVGAGAGAYKNKKLANERQQNQQNFNDQVTGSNGDMEQLAAVLAESGQTELAMTIMSQVASQKRADEQRQKDLERQMETERKAIEREEDRWNKTNSEWDRRYNMQNQNSGGMSQSLQEKMIMEDYKNQIKQQNQTQEQQAEQQQKDSGLLAGLRQGANVITNEDFSDAVGPADQFTSKIGRVFGSDDSRANTAAQRFLADEVLNKSGLIKGNITEAEWPRVEQSLPAMGSHATEWVDWYMNLLDAAERSNPALSDDIGQLRQQVLTSADQEFGYTSQKKSPTPGQAPQGFDTSGFGAGPMANDPLGLGL